MNDVQMFWSLCVECVEFLSQRRTLQREQNTSTFVGDLGLVSRSQQRSQLKVSLVFRRVLFTSPRVTRFKLSAILWKTLTRSCMMLIFILVGIHGG